MRRNRERRVLRQRRLRPLLRAAAGMVTLAGLVLLGLNLAVTRSAEGLAFDDPSATPARPVAIVFGAGVIDGRPTPALEDRIRGAVALYHAGRVQHLLMTGDHSSTHYDEVTVMRDVAIAAGVPPSAITRDHAGFSTYDSCVRAHTIFGVRAAILVTQDYHLSRALYTCEQQGIAVIGLRVPDWQHHAERLTFAYPDDLQRSYTAREWIARAKAVVDSHVLRPAPTFGGPYEGLRPT